MIVFIRRILNILQKEEPKILGRWNIEKNIKKINNKVDLANEDHCGICNEYMNKKKEVPLKDIFKDLNRK